MDAFFPQRKVSKQDTGQMQVRFPPERCFWTSDVYRYRNPNVRPFGGLVVSSSGLFSTNAAL